MKAFCMINRVPKCTCSSMSVVYSSVPHGQWYNQVYQMTIGVPIVQWLNSGKVKLGPMKIQGTKRERKQRREARGGK